MGLGRVLRVTVQEGSRGEAGEPGCVQERSWSLDMAEGLEGITAGWSVSHSSATHWVTMGTLHDPSGPQYVSP